MMRFIKPANGAPVRKPDGTHLSDAGELVVWSTYWHRRVDDGDVEIATQEKGAE